MTKITLNVILSILDGLHHNADQGDYIERVRADESTESALHCHMDVMRQEKIRMRELHVDLEKATYYLISLFEETGKIYTCTRIKLGKILSIAAFKCARNGILLFDEHIFKHCQCGSVVEGISAFTNMEAYICFSCKDGNKKVSDDYDKKIVGNISIFENEDFDIDFVTELIKDVFERFGAYSARALGECISSIVDCEGVSVKLEGVDLEKVDLEKVSMLTLQDVKARNELVEYLFTDEENVDE